MRRGLEGTKPRDRAGCSPPAATSAPVPPPREKLQVQSCSCGLGCVPLFLGAGCTLRGNGEQDQGVSLVPPDRISNSDHGKELTVIKVSAGSYRRGHREFPAH